SIHRLVVATGVGGHSRPRSRLTPTPLDDAEQGGHGLVSDAQLPISLRTRETSRRKVASEPSPDMAVGGVKGIPFFLQAGASLSSGVVRRSVRRRLVALGSGWCARP